MTRTKQNRLKAIQAYMQKHNLVPDDPDNCIRNVANIIRDIFLQHKRRALPFYKLSQAYDNIFWDAIAVNVLEADIDPVLYSTTICAAAQQWLRPELLSGTSSIARFKGQYNPDVHRHEVELELVLSAERFKWTVDTQNISPRDELQNPAGGYSDLFRWCIAVKLKFNDLAERYHKNAKLMLLRPVYKELYTKYFPEVVS